MTTKKKDLSIVPANEERRIAVPSVDEFKAMLEENYGDPNAQPEFQRIKYPTSGARTFTVPSPEGDESVQALEGVVLHTTTPKALWLGSFSGNAPPDCSSVDGKLGQLRVVESGAPLVLPEWAQNLGMPGGDCATCPYNQWGTKRNPDGSFGRGKACKDMRRLWLLRKGDLLPMIVTLPPTSLNAFEAYANKLMAKGTGLRTVVTRVGLSEERNSAGIKYQVATMTQQDKVDAEMVSSIRQFAAFIAPMVKKVVVSTDDYRVDEEGVIRDTP